MSKGALKPEAPVFFCTQAEFTPKDLCLLWGGLSTFHRAGTAHGCDPGLLCMCRSVLKV